MGWRRRASPAAMPVRAANSAVEVANENAARTKVSYVPNRQHMLTTSQLAAPWVASSGGPADHALRPGCETDGDLEAPAAPAARGGGQKAAGAAAARGTPAGLTCCSVPAADAGRQQLACCAAGLANADEHWPGASRSSSKLGLRRLGEGTVVGSARHPQAASAQRLHRRPLLQACVAESAALRHLHIHQPGSAAVPSRTGWGVVGAGEDRRAPAVLASCKRASSWQPRSTAELSVLPGSAPAAPACSAVLQVQPSAARLTMRQFPRALGADSVCWSFYGASRLSRGLTRYIAPRCR